jgi:hypothetical protein
MEAITSITVDFSDATETTIQVDFFRSDYGVITYDLSIHSLGGYKETKMIVPLVEVLGLMNWIAANVITWDAITIDEEVTNWKRARAAMKEESVLK